MPNAHDQGAKDSVAVAFEIAARRPKIIKSAETVTHTVKIFLNRSQNQNQVWYHSHYAWNALVEKRCANFVSAPGGHFSEVSEAHHSSHVMRQTLYMTSHWANITRVAKCMKGGVLQERWGW